MTLSISHDFCMTWWMALATHLPAWHCAVVLGSGGAGHPAATVTAATDLIQFNVSALVLSLVIFDPIRLCCCCAVVDRLLDSINMRSCYWKVLQLIDVTYWGLYFFLSLNHWAAHWAPNDWAPNVQVFGCPAISAVVEPWKSNETCSETIELLSKTMPDKWCRFYAVSVMMITWHIMRCFAWKQHFRCKLGPRLSHQSPVITMTKLWACQERADDASAVILWLTDWVDILWWIVALVCTLDQTRHYVWPTAPSLKRKRSSTQPQVEHGAQLKKKEINTQDLAPLSFIHTGWKISLWICWRICWTSWKSHASNDLQSKKSSHFYHLGWQSLELCLGVFLKFSKILPQILKDSSSNSQRFFLKFSNNWGIFEK